MPINKKIIQTIIDSELWWKTKEFEEELKKLDSFSWTKYPIVDAHIHIVDFNQKTLGLKKLLKYMDDSNIIAWVVFWLPVVKSWQENEVIRPSYYLDDDNPCYYYSNTDVIVAREYQKLSKSEQKRIFPLLCGFNPNDISSVEHIKQTFLSFPWVFYGIWEIFYRHDDLTHLTYWEVPRMNTLATKKLFEFISEYDLPLCIHNNITAPWISDYPKFLHEMEDVIREFPKAKVILSHAWASRRLRSPYYTKMISRLLREYPGLYVDLSWVVFDEIIAVNDTSMQEWVDMAEKFPNRIMIWSDVLWDEFEEIWVVNSRYNTFLDKLTPETRERICFKNALEIYSKSKNKVEKNKTRNYPKLSDFKK